MPKASKASASTVQELPGYEGRFEQLGEHTVGFERFEEAVDAAPLFQGLPDDRCQSPHWGIVVAGSITFRYADHEETIEAGEAYYAAARPHAGARRRDRGHRVQPDGAAAGDDGRRRPQRRRDARFTLVT